MSVKDSGRLMKAAHVFLRRRIWLTWDYYASKPQKEREFLQSDWGPNTVWLVWIRVINCFDYAEEAHGVKSVTRRAGAVAGLMNGAVGGRK